MAAPTPAREGGRTCCFTAPFQVPVWNSIPELLAEHSQRLSVAGEASLRGFSHHQDRLTFPCNPSQGQREAAPLDAFKPSSSGTFLSTDPGTPAPEALFGAFSSQPELSPRQWSEPSDASLRRPCPEEAPVNRWLTPSHLLSNIVSNRLTFRKK